MPDTMQKQAVGCGEFQYPKPSVTGLVEGHGSKVTALSSPWEGLALGSAEGLEGGQVSDIVSMHSDKVHDITDTQPWEDANAG